MTTSGLIGAASVAALLAGGAGGAAAATRLDGHVAKWISKAVKVGSADDGQVVRMHAFLGLRNHDALTKLIAEQATPNSPVYNRYLTAAQFHTRFSPSPHDEQAVEAGLREAGFTVTGKVASNLYVDFTGTVAQVKAAFGVSQDLYAYAGKRIRANAEGPTIPASLAGLVTAITGLDDTAQLIHPYHVSIRDEADAAPRAAAAAAVARPGGSPAVTLPVAANLPSPYCSTYYGDTAATLTTAPSPYPAKTPWLVCAYTPAQIRAAYGADKSTLDGSGVTVAIVDAYASPTLAGDVARYSRNHGLPKLSVGSNLQVIYNGNLAAVSNDDVCQPQGWFGEITLDVEAVHAMAPGARILYSGALSCSDSDLDDALYTVIDGTATTGGPLASIVSNSYGEEGEPLSDAQEAVETAIFEQAAVEGVTLLFSSGDDGDVAQNIGIADASWPAASPFVTAVGGTSLALTSASGAKTEWGWGTFRAYLTGAKVNSAQSVTDTGVGSFSFYAGAGGGPSLTWLEPAYQVHVVPIPLGRRTFDINGKRFTLPGDRVAPDVAMDADPYTGFLIGETYLIAGDPVADAGCTPVSATREYCEDGIGGTSLASPLFAGVVAVVDQLRHANGLGDLGFANPRLYALARGAPGSGAPLADVLPPAAPTAMLRGYVNDPTRVRLITVNSTPGPYGPLCTASVCEGQDSLTLQTKPKYDNVTGLGTPYVPALAAALASAP